MTPEFDFEYADVCTRWSSMLTWVYTIIFMFIGLAIFKTGNAGLARVKQMIGAVSTVARVAANSGGVGIQLQPNKKKDD